MDNKFRTYCSNIVKQLCLGQDFSAFNISINMLMCIINLQYMCILFFRSILQTSVWKFMPQEMSSIATKWQKEGHLRVFSVGQVSACLSFQAPGFRKRLSQTPNSQQGSRTEGGAEGLCGPWATSAALSLQPLPLSVTPGAG